MEPGIVNVAGKFVCVPRLDEIVLLERSSAVVL